jgi:molecular chaperone Hsp33
VQAPQPVRFGCRCSASRAASTLQSLGEAEARAILAEQGTILIHCEFCQQEYRFDAAALDGMFHVEVPAARH